MATGAEHRLSLGEIIRRQREVAEVPMRQLAAMTGISNPYLSQIENGLREPSAKVLTALAEALQVSVDDLQEAAKAAREDDSKAVLAAVAADQGLTRRQRQALIEVYQAMIDATGARRHGKA
jgi:transcriptional regulator with XRE-family HTH domain